MGAETAYNMYNPLHVVSIWTEPSITTKCVLVVLLLPSGVGAGDYSTRVREGERELEVHVKWTLPFCNIEMLCCKWQRSEEDRLESYHP